MEYGGIDLHKKTVRFGSLRKVGEVIDRLAHLVPDVARRDAV
jgi:hypothetical protein